MTIRITGMASGMDIDKLVSDLMKAERMPLDKIKQKKTTALWTTDLYREINSKLASFRNIVDDMKLTGDWKAVKTTSSDTAAVGVSATAAASTVSHTLSNITLATGATKTSASTLSPDLDGSTDLSAGLTIDGTNNKFTVTFNGIKKQITLPQGSYTGVPNNTAGSLIKAINDQLDTAFGAGVLSVSAGSAGTNLQFTSSTAGQISLNEVAGNLGLVALGFSDGQSNRLDPNTQTFAEGNLVINGTTIAIAATDTLTTIMNKVNTSDAGVTMFYDSRADKISLVSKTTGTAASIDLTGSIGTGASPLSSDNFLAQFGFDDAVVYGQDASAMIDGTTVYSSTNTITQSGVTYTLNKNTTGPVSVSVARDTDAMFNMIKDFVTKYNDTVDLLGRRINEKKDRNYQPLTDDQKKDMKDADIAIWETRAKAGLLHSDSIVSRTLNDLRALTSSTVTGTGSTYNALYSIGITTSPYNASSPQDAAKLTIDESKLRDALEKDPDGVIAMFANQPSDYSQTNQKGIAQRMYEVVNGSITELISKAGNIGAEENNITNDLGAKVNKYEKDITAFEARLTTKETYYYKQFSAMEQAIQKSNTQLNWLSQQFS